MKYIKLYKVFESDDSFNELLEEEVDGILVDLSDGKFSWFTNISEAGNYNVVEIWLDVLASFDTDEEAEDFYEDEGQIFKIREVYEPVELLVEWMKEKYNADLVDEGLQSETFNLEFVETAYNAAVLDPDILTTNSQWLKNEYMNEKVTALFIKFKWKK